MLKPAFERAIYPNNVEESKESEDRGEANNLDPGYKDGIPCSLNRSI